MKIRSLKLKFNPEHEPTFVLVVMIQLGNEITGPPGWKAGETAEQLLEIGHHVVRRVI